MDRSCEDIDQRQIIGRSGKQAINQTTDFWLLFDYDCSPGWGVNRWVDPSLKGHPIGEIQRIRVIHGYPVGSIEVESSTAESSLAGPGCAANGSCVAVPRRVCYRRPAPLI